MKQTYPVVVCGAGAVGRLVALRAALAGAAVTVAASGAARAAALRQSGIRGVAFAGAVEQHVVVAAVGPAAEWPDDALVLLCVKAYDTTRALADHAAGLARARAVLSLQNGIGNAERIAERCPGRTLAGTTTTGAFIDGDDRVVCAGEGKTRIGAFDAPEAAAADAAAAMGAWGFDAEVTADPRAAMWLKAAVNAAINPITALLNVPNGALPAHPSLPPLMCVVCAEAARAAATQGVLLNAEEALEAALDTARRTAANTSSMRADLRAGRRTEIDAINGEIARRTRAPVCALLTRLVQARGG